MTTKSAKTTSAAPRPEATNWQALASQLALNSTGEFSGWIDGQLELLEQSQARFVTKRSQLKSLRRS